MSAPPPARDRCSATCSHDFTIERRRSDFERDLRVTPFTGSCCCCCCCLHWIGAAAGGIVGMRMGWQGAEKKLETPLPDRAKAALRTGLFVGVALSTALLAGACALGFTGLDGSLVGGAVGVSQGYLVALAFVPSLAFLPVGVPILLATYGLRSKMLRAFRKDMAKLPAKEGSDKSMSLYRAKLTVPPKTRDTLAEFSVFCPHCWCDVAESLHLATCPECDKPLDHPAISGPDYGVRVAWRATLVSFGLSTAGTAGGYVLMLLISLLFR